MRSARSAGPSAVVVGMMTAPSFIDREHRLPQLDLVAEHQHHAVARADAERRGARSPPGRSGAPSRRRCTFASLPSSSTIHSAMPSLSRAIDVEPVDGPVERPVDLRPVELGDRSGVVSAEREDLVAGGAVGLGRGTVGHGADLLLVGLGTRDSGGSSSAGRGPTTPRASTRDLRSRGHQELMATTSQVSRGSAVGGLVDGARDLRQPPARPTPTALDDLGGDRHRGLLRRPGAQVQPDR